MKPTEFIKRLLNFISTCGDDCNVILGHNKDPNVKIMIYQDDDGNMVITDDVIENSQMDVKDTIDQLTRYVEALQVEQNEIRDKTNEIIRDI